MIIAISGKKQHGKNTIATIIQYLVWTYNKQASVGVYNLKAFFDQSKEKQESDSGFAIKAFADKLKDIVCLLLGCTREQLEDSVFKETKLGEEWRVWYVSNYKFASNHNTKGMISALYNSKEEAEQWLSSNKKNFGEGLLVNTYVLTPRLLMQLLGTECGRKIIHPNIWVNALMSEYKAYPNWIIADTRFPNEAAAVKSKQGLVVRVHRPGINNDDKHESETALDNYPSFDAVFNNIGDIMVLVDQVETYLLEQQIINKWK